MPSIGATPHTLDTLYGYGFPNLETATDAEIRDFYNQLDDAHQFQQNYFTPVQNDDAMQNWGYATITNQPGGYQTQFPSNVSPNTPHILYRQGINVDAFQGTGTQWGLDPYTRLSRGFWGQPVAEWAADKDIDSLSDAELRSQLEDEYDRYLSSGISGGLLNKIGPSLIMAAAGGAAGNLLGLTNIGTLPQTAQSINIGGQAIPATFSAPISGAASAGAAGGAGSDLLGGMQPGQPIDLVGGASPASGAEAVLDPATGLLGMGAIPESAIATQLTPAQLLGVSSLAPQGLLGIEDLPAANPSNMGAPLTPNELAAAEMGGFSLPNGATTAGRLALGLASGALGGQQGDDAGNGATLSEYVAPDWVNDPVPTRETTQQAPTLEWADTPYTNQQQAERLAQGIAPPQWWIDRYILGR